MAIGDDFEKLHPVHGLKVTRDGGVYGRRGRLLKPSTTRAGYRLVAVSTNGIIKHCSVHRLVAETFIANPDNLSQVNHKDGNKSNNAADNLEWCSSSQNNRHALATGLRDMSKRSGHKDTVGAKNGRAKLNASLVREIRALTVVRGEQPWRRFGISYEQFSSIRKNLSWTSVE